MEGEIGNLRTAGSGHAYFTLGDGGRQIRAVCFRSVVRLLPVRPVNGLHVLARGRLTLYEERGDLQLVVEDCEPLGSGLQRLELEKLKRKLLAEGLFSAERKRSLPALPRSVGVVTSPVGAALGDILKVLERRAPGVSVFLAPARVQGRSAPQELREALGLAADFPGIDVVILGRGGGSAEDLSAFNEEALVRAVAASPVPVISAVGHEADVTLADLAADARAPTPSAAAEMAVREWAHCVEQVARWEAALSGSLARQLERLRSRLERQERALPPPDRRIERLRVSVDRRVEVFASYADRRLRQVRGRTSQLEGRLSARSPLAELSRNDSRLRDAEARLRRAAEVSLESCRRDFACLEARLSALSPLAVLDRGYAIVTRERRVVSDPAACDVGDPLDVRLARGTLGCIVSRVGGKEPG